MIKERIEVSMKFIRFRYLPCDSLCWKQFYSRTITLLLMFNSELPGEQFSLRKTQNCVVFFFFFFAIFLLLLIYYLIVLKSLLSLIVFTFYTINPLRQYNQSFENTLCVEFTEKNIQNISNTTMH